MCDVSQSLQAESGEPHLDGRKAENVLRVRDGEAEHGCPADVLPDEMNRTNAEFGNEVVQIFGDSLAVVVPRCVRRVAEATQFDTEDAMFRGEKRDDLPKGPPGLREAMAQKDRGAARSAGDEVRFVSVAVRPGWGITGDGVHCSDLHWVLLNGQPCPFPGHERGDAKQYHRGDHLKDGMSMQ